jgi:hypothetical protein
MFTQLRYGLRVLAAGSSRGSAAGHSGGHSPRHNPQTESVQTDETTDLACKDGTAQHAMDSQHPARNRKVVGSNPTSGSKTAGQSRLW